MPSKTCWKNYKPQQKTEHSANRKPSAQTRVSTTEQPNSANRKPSAQTRVSTAENKNSPMAETAKKRNTGKIVSPVKRKSSAKQRDDIENYKKYKKLTFLQPYKQYMPTLEAQHITKHNLHHKNQGLPEPFPERLGGALKKDQGVYVTFKIQCKRDNDHEQAGKENNDDEMEIVIYGKVIHKAENEKKVVIHYTDGQHILGYTDFTCTDTIEYEDTVYFAHENEEHEQKETNDQTEKQSGQTEKQNDQTEKAK